MTNAYVDAIRRDFPRNHLDLPGDTYGLPSQTSTKPTKFTPPISGNHPPPSFAALRNNLHDVAGNQDCV